MGKKHGSQKCLMKWEVVFCDWLWGEYQAKLEKKIQVRSRRLQVFPLRRETESAVPSSSLFVMGECTK